MAGLSAGDSAARGAAAVGPGVGGESGMGSCWNKVWQVATQIKRSPDPEAAEASREADQGVQAVKACASGEFAGRSRRGCR
jgi:hypothetical protein